MCIYILFLNSDFLISPITQEYKESQQPLPDQNKTDSLVFTAVQARISITHLQKSRPEGKFHIQCYQKEPK